jgi:predicted nuclease with TOPRIM domain
VWSGTAVNPFVKTYIDQMQILISDLSKTLEEYERRLQQAQDDKEEKVREWWIATRKVSALEETLGRIPGLEEENTLLQEKNQKTVEHARRILELAKALSGAVER